MANAASTDDGRPSPEALLAAVAKENRGQLKVFLGYTSGVGKSFRLFDEGRRRRERGEDVVVLATQPAVPHDLALVIETLEVISTREIEGVPVLDVAAALARRPQVCLAIGPPGWSALPNPSVGAGRSDVAPVEPSRLPGGATTWHGLIAAGSSD